MRVYIIDALGKRPHLGGDAPSLGGDASSPGGDALPAGEESFLTRAYIIFTLRRFLSHVSFS